MENELVNAERAEDVDFVLRAQNSFKSANKEEMLVYSFMFHRTIYSFAIGEAGSNECAFGAHKANHDWFVYGIIKGKMMPVYAKLFKLNKLGARSCYDLAEAETWAFELVYDLIESGKLANDDPNGVESSVDDVLKRFGYYPKSGIDKEVYNGMKRVIVEHVEDKYRDLSP